MLFLHHFLLAFLFLQQCCYAGKDHTQPRHRSNADVDDAPLSLSDWFDLSLETLRLKCNSLNLSSRGARAVLARRLYHHHHPPASLVVAASSSGAVTTSVATTTCSPVTMDAVRDEFRAMIPELVAAMRSDDTPPPPRQSSSSTHPDEHTVATPPAVC